MQVLDRRLNPGGKNLENRQRFLRRAKALVQQAARQSAQSRDISDILNGGEISIPASGVDEPRFHHRPGGIHDKRNSYRLIQAPGVSAQAPQGVSADPARGVSKPSHTNTKGKVLTNLASRPPVVEFRLNGSHVNFGIKWADG